MVTRAALEHQDLYTVIGMPVDKGDEAVLNFIEEGEASALTHLRDTKVLWDELGITGTPSYVTITASGEIDIGIGAMPREVLEGDWIG